MHDDLFSTHVQGLTVRSGSAQAYGKCPFHDDKLASFSCNLLTGLWSCHAGCGVGNAKSFAQRLGVNPFSPTSVAFSPPMATPIHPKALTSFRTGGAEPISKIKATYTYHYEDGSDAFQVCRLEPKSFRQRRNVNGTWVWGLGDIRRVPYRLPRILGAGPTEVIHLVEGEKDVETLENLQMVATTTPMGASAWRNEYATYFRGKRVALIPDNDPAGKNFAQIAARDLLMAGAQVKLVHLPGLPEKGDVTDFVSNVPNPRHELSRLIKQAPAAKQENQNTQLPAEYFQEQKLDVFTSAESLLPTEFRQYCRDNYRLVTEHCEYDPAMDPVLDELVKIQVTCNSELKFKRHLMLLKKLHLIGGREKRTAEASPAEAA